jgi:hypothetical protein
MTKAGLPRPHRRRHRRAHHGGPAGRSHAVPEGATRVTGRGKYLMPGLAEMHGHIPPPTAPREFVDNVLFLYVATGVTTVRGMQGAPGQLELREARKRGEIVAPNSISQARSSAARGQVGRGCRARVRQQKSEGWDLLKVQEGLAARLYDSMAKTAKEVVSVSAVTFPTASDVIHAMDMGQETVRSHRWLRRAAGRPREGRRGQGAPGSRPAHEEGGRLDRADHGRVGDAAGTGHARVANQAGGAALHAGAPGRAVDESARDPFEEPAVQRAAGDSCTSTTGFTS